jgi:hypothetical protein
MSTNRKVCGKKFECVSTTRYWPAARDERIFAAPRIASASGRAIATRVVCHRGRGRDCLLRVRVVLHRFFLPPIRLSTLQSE